MKTFYHLPSEFVWTQSSLDSSIWKLRNSEILLRVTLQITRTAKFQHVLYWSHQIMHYSPLEKVSKTGLQTSILNFFQFSLKLWSEWGLYLILGVKWSNIATIHREVHFCTLLVWIYFYARHQDRVNELIKWSSVPRTAHPLNKYQRIYSKIKSHTKTKVLYT